MSSPIHRLLSDKGISIATAAEFKVFLSDRGKCYGNYDPEWASFLQKRIVPSLVFPLYDMHSTFKGFAYRTDSVKFSYDTSFFIKPSELLYGLHKTHTSIAQQDYAIVVEGPFDFLKVYDSGIHNVVSTLGAKMSWAQMCMLARFCKSVFICYDPDVAGQQATRKASAILKQGGLLPVPVRLNKDPDEFVADYGPRALLETCFQSLKSIEPARLLTI